MAKQKAPWEAWTPQALTFQPPARPTPPKIEVPPVFLRDIFDHLKQWIDWDVWRVLHERLLARFEQGMQSYGVPLTSHNGRDALQDAWEEAADLCLYLKQAEMEDHKVKAYLVRAAFDMLAELTEELVKRDRDTEAADNT